MFDGSNLNPGRIHPLTMSKRPVGDFIQEEKELYEVCSPSVVALYTFFDMFSFTFTDSDYATISFGDSYEDDEVSKEVAKQCKAYIKEQKRTLREKSKSLSVSFLRNRLFWMISMILRHGVFSDKNQGKLLGYAGLVVRQIEQED